MYLSSTSSPRRSLSQTIDWQLVACYLAIIFIGWINIYASVHATEMGSIFDPESRSGKQFMWMGISIVVDVLILFAINAQLWEQFSPLTYLLVFGLLILVIFVSKDVKGSHSWFELGPVKFQPAEVSKITTSLLLALIMSRQGYKLTTVRGFFSAALVIGLPMLAILAEQETGSALVYVGFVFVLYREGMSGWVLVCGGLAILLFILTLVTNWWISLIVLACLCICFCLFKLLGRRRNTRKRRTRIIFSTIATLLLGAALIGATDFIFNNVLQDHQRKRIEVLLGLKDDPAGVGYNVRQSMIAIGSGGAFGKGYLQGTQTTYGFVPEQATDFIFCTIGEEWGFVGCLAVIALFVFMIYRIIKDAEESREPFTRIYGYCVAACLFMHLFINISMTIGLMPVIGIPLPMISYGGSSLLAFSALIFIFLALYRKEKRYF